MADDIEIGQNITVFVNATDLNLSTVIAELDAAYNQTMTLVSGDQYTTTFTYPAYASLGTHDLRFYGIDGSGNTNSTTTASMYVNDTTIPEVYNSNIADITYGEDVTIKVDVFDYGTIDETIVQVNGTNYTLQNEVGNRYNTTISGLAAGTYDVTYFINDSFGNMNSTTTDSFIVNKSDPNVNLLLNGFNGDVTISDLDDLNMTATMIAPENISIFMDGILQATGTSPLENLTQLSAGDYEIKANYTGNQNYTSGSESFIVSVTQTIIHNFTITSMTAPSSSNVNEDIEVNVTIENTGSVSDSSNIKLYVGGELNSTQTISALAPGASVTKTFTFAYPEDVSNLELKAVVETLTGETDTADNTQTKYIDILGTHDIAISNIAVNKSSTIYVNDVLLVSADITNNGNVNEESADISFESSNGDIFTDSKIISIDKGQTKQINFTFAPTSKDYHTLIVKSNLQNDENTTNDQVSTEKLIVSAKDNADLTFVNTDTYPSANENINSTMYVFVSLENLYPLDLEDFRLTLDSAGLDVINSTDNTANSYHTFDSLAEYDTQSYWWLLNTTTTSGTKDIKVSIGSGSDKEEISRSVVIA